MQFRYGNFFTKDTLLRTSEELEASITISWLLVKFSLRLMIHISQHVLQNTTVFIVLNFVERIDPAQ